MVRNTLILLFGAIIAAWLVWKPVPLKPAEGSSSLPTFAQVQDDHDGAPPYAATTRISGAGPRQPANCHFPPLPQGARLVMLSAHRGQAVSTAALGSQDKIVTSASLTIAPGDEPLYIVMVTADAVIWRVAGAVERVHRLVLVRGGGEVGAIGLPLRGAGLRAKLRRGGHRASGAVGRTTQHGIGPHARCRRGGRRRVGLCHSVG